MNEQKFDPMTGEQIGQQQSGFKFDPMTGKPLNPQSGYKYDPMTGKPLIQGNQPTGYGMQQSNAYGYDPAAIEKEQSDKNKKLAFTIAGVCASLFLITGIIGVVKLTKIVAAKNLEKDIEKSVMAEVPDEDQYVDTGIEGLELEKITEPTLEDFGLTEEEESAEETADEQVDEQDGDSVPLDAIAEENSTKSGSETDTRNLFTFQIGDESYQIPGKVSDYLDKGWTFDDDIEAATIIDSYSKEFLEFYYPGGRNSLLVDITNFSLDAQEAKDCYITKISLSDYDMEEFGNELTIHGGDLVLGKSTEADIVAAMGEPDELFEGTYGDVLYYYGDSSNSLEYCVGYSLNEDRVFENIRLTNENEPVGFEQVDVSSERPSYLDNYVAPSSLGDDPFSGNFELDGTVYNLPVPFEELTRNGWKYDGDENYSVGSGQEYVIQFRKGNMSFTTNVYNPTDKAILLKYTIVVMIGANNSSYDDYLIQFPGGLNCDLTEEEVKEYIKNNGIENYEYKKGSSSYSIPFDQTGKIRSAANNEYTIFMGEKTVYFMHVRNYGWLFN